jgi:hypothetical protein
VSDHKHFSPSEHECCSECNPTEYEHCETPGCVAVATFIVYREDGIHTHCEPHGRELGLNRGIPAVENHNHAEPASRCIGCGAPLESAIETHCNDCHPVTRVIDLMRIGFGLGLGGKIT